MIVSSAVRIGLYTLLFFILLCAGSLFYIFTHHIVDFSPLAHYEPGHPSILLDDQGNEWGRFQLDRREPIPLTAMPAHLINAFIAAEDWQFYSHAGISWKGIARSLWVNLIHAKKLQGASTITQQLVKLLFFDSQKTFKRKIKEQLYALLAERQCTKEQILETYLNYVYFGHGMYGVQAAAARFWGIEAGQLSVAQSAALAAIIRSPGRYSPISCALSHERRRNTILASMKKLGFISQEEYEQAIKTSTVVKDSEKSIFAPHVKEMIRIQLEEEVGKQILYTGGLRIQTTLNSRMQELAQQSFAKEIEQLKKTITQEIDGALLSIASKTGQVKALVGGFNFNQSKFNRAWQAKRQIGSVFKPILYAAALQHGAHFYDVQIDEPLTLEQDNALWQPNNYNGKFDGPMTLARALVGSNNIISIKTLLKMGAHSVINLAKACHLEDTLRPYPSLALGCVDATLKEVAGMFNIFANNGIYVQPHLIEWVKDSWGKKIWKYTGNPERVLPEWAACHVAKVLEHNIKRWRSTYHQQFIESDVISKTGTTNDCRTCWFAGATPGLTTVVYVGADDNRALGEIYPIRTAFPIWLGLHAQLNGDKKFIYDPKYKSIRINQWTGRWARENDPDGIEIFV